MNTLLIVGNGFDLANGLPTSYINFLDYMKHAKKEFDNYSKSYEGLLHAKLCIKAYEPYDSICKKAEKIGEITDFMAMNVACLSYRDSILAFLHARKKEVSCFPPTEDFFQYVQENEHCAEYNVCLFYSFLYGNLWLDYFNESLRTSLKKSWIDFEGEISRVIQYIEDILIRFQEEGDVNLNIDNHKIPSINVFMNQIQGKIINHKSNIISLRSYISVLLSEMRIFVRCLELYMFLIGKLPDSLIDIQSDIKQIFTVNWFLNFNYTNTFQRYYNIGCYLDNKDGCVDYIHGKAGLNNIIIGVKDTLDSQHEDTILECINFKKYFQRIFYKTGVKYRQWLPDTKQDHNDTVVYIFGHSLDETDGEVFRYIICNPNVKRTTIYYHNDLAYQAKIRNLIKIIGKDELIQRTGVENIVFLRQT